ncbi:DUF1566 domain-containing protein [bacterium]|nr:DUF1566 domain-containing protein [bacterium]
MKWNIFKFLSENKEAGKELGEWMNQQLEKGRTQEEGKKDTKKKSEEEKVTEKSKPVEKVFKSMEWTADDDDDDDGNEPSFFVNRNASLNGAEANKLFSPENFRDRGDHIELVKPIENIRMIEKDCFGFLLSWKDAMIYAQTVMKGGYRDWRVPTMEELVVIYKIKDVCGINKCNDWFWSSSECDGGLNAWRVSMHAGFSSNGIKSGKYYVRCIR